MDFDDFNSISKEVTKDVPDLKFIDIYVQQRNARKKIITIQGLGNDKEILKGYAKQLRKILSCSCSIDTNEDNQYFLKMSGKDLDEIKKYLVEKLNIDINLIRVHGE
jgi:translation initiation factor SUI1